jgi:hypothetical protein
MNIPMKYEPYEGTIFNTNGYKNSRKSIFISIVSYKDPYIVRTVNSILKNAKRPDNIFISIALSDNDLNYDYIATELMHIYENNKNNMDIETVELSNKLTFGQLKKIADSKYNKEDYYMSVSSRSEFDPHWDSILIKQFTEIENNMGPKNVITAEPRNYLPHDDVVKGFVYFTNHKTKMSMQREEYDGSRIPVSGYTEFVNDNNKNFDQSQEEVGSDISQYLIEKENVKIDDEFLKTFHFPRFNSRKFIKDEYIALSTGLSYKFIFTSAKNYIKNNSFPKSLVDEGQFNFYSFINFIINDFNVITLRFIPVYQLYEDIRYSGENQKSPSDLYNLEDYLQSEGINEIKRMLEKNVYDDEKFNILLSIDWEKLKFKPRSIFSSNSFVDAVNSFISLYNFSTYENSLHWNKKC